jgi:putative transmembrane protein
MQKLAVEFGATLLCNFLSQIESKCKEAVRRMKKADNAILIPDTAFYILIIIVVALSSFFVCMIGANAEILHSVLIWKAVICCIIMAVLGIGIAVVIQKFSNRGK